MHELLAAHSNVFIPKKEIFFFDIDDINQHSDFFIRRGSHWITQNFERDLDVNQKWYRSFFAPAKEGQLIGEDSTTYISSSLAPARIDRLLPEVKLVAILRDPVDRAYSAYWHGVTTGRSGVSFEDTILFRPGQLINRGFYKEQLQRYCALFPPDRLKIIFFEQFVADTQGTMDDLCRFLGLADSIDVSAVGAHRNKARPPLNLNARLLLNRTLGALVRVNYRRHLPNMPGYKPAVPEAESKSSPILDWVVERYYDLLPERKYPAMDPETRTLLEQVYRRANTGIDELLDCDVSQYWPYMKQQ